MKNRIALTIILIVILLLLILNIRALFLIIKKDSKLNQIKNEIGNCETYVQLLQTSINFNSFVSGYKFEKEAAIIDIKGDTMPLINLIKEENILALIYSELNCQICVDSALVLLNKKLPENNNILLTNYHRRQDVYEFKKMHNIKHPVYKVINSELYNWIMKYNFPVFIIVDKNLLITSSFVPLKEFPELTKNFFESYSKKLPSYKSE